MTYDHALEKVYNNLCLSRSYKFVDYCDCLGAYFKVLVHLLCQLSLLDIEILSICIKSAELEHVISQRTSLIANA